jgi:predicted GIY-YIG superfamily endonuclease
VAIPSPPHPENALKKEIAYKNIEQVFKINLLKQQSNKEKEK